MPYNSAAFEQQLAKFKKQQAAKAGLAEEKTEDAHVTKPRVEVGRGTVTPNVLSDPLAEKAAVPTKETETVVIVEAAPKKPFYRQSWFVFLLFSVAISGAMPMVMKGQMDDMWGMANTVNSTTGVDIFSPETYKKMFAGQPVAIKAPAYEPRTNSATPEGETAAAENPIKAIVKTVKEKAQKAKAPATAQSETAEQPTATAPLQSATDIHQMVDMAAEKAKEVTAGGTESSMKYIEEESKRLQKMAEEFDNTYGENK